MAECIALLPAAGSGQRCGALKQFAPLCGRSVLWHAVQPFLSCAQVTQVRVVVAADKVTAAQQALADGAVQVLPVGGETRAASVYNGLAQVPPQTWVLVHDAARPCLSAAALARLLAVCDEDSGDGAVLALPQDDALKQVADGRLTATVARDGVWAMQTPQLFRAGRLRQVLQQFPAAADEAEAVLAAGGAVQVVPGERQNIKITVSEDLSLAERLLRTAEESE